MKTQWSNAALKLGTWLSMGAPVAAELAGLCGFDWLLIDLEHGAMGEQVLFQTLQALRGSPATIIVRVGDIHADLIQRVLDWGADGIMVPHVDTVERARACVACAHFPPQGTRGYSRSARAFDYGLNVPQALPRPLILAQIESAAGVQNVEAIAAVDGIDILFVGPADLALDLKARAVSMDFETCLDSVIKAANTHTKLTGLLIRDEAEVAHRQAQGFSIIAIDSDLAILRRRFQDLVAHYRP